jgi:hypothetical protein
MKASNVCYVLPVPGVTGVRELLRLHADVHLFVGLDINQSVVHHVLNVSESVGDVLCVDSRRGPGTGPPVSETDNKFLSSVLLLCFF